MRGPSSRTALTDFGEGEVGACPERLTGASASRPLVYPPSVSRIGKPARWAPPDRRPV